MKVAITVENGEVFQHFGHSKQFKLYTVTDGAVTPGAVIDAGGSGHGALAGFLKENEVEALICGGIGAGARTALSEAGIALYPGVSGNADEAAQALASGRLVFDPDTVCAHHHEEQGEGHDCASGGCKH